MKLESLKLNPTTNITVNSSAKTPSVKPVEQLNETAPQKVYASHLGFRGGVPLTSLMNDYRWFINCDKIPAVNSFLKINAPKEGMESLLRQILSNEESGFQFIDSIVNQPRNISEIYTKLNEKLPYNSELVNVAHPFNPYYKTYCNYLENRYKNASSVSELLKIRPDWKEEVLLQKHRELYHNDNFELGYIPQSIGNENYAQLIDYLKSNMQFGFKLSRVAENININGKNFSIKTIIDGKSDKNVFEIGTESGEKFIIKIADKNKRSLDDAFSLGTCCKIDSYLTQNNCRNSAPLRYYDHNSNSAIYDYINHSKVTPPGYGADITANGRRIPDLRDLGLSQNDTVGNNNYFKLDNTQKTMQSSYDYNYGISHDELVSVDNDHATYNSILNPTVRQYNKELPNGMTGMFF